MTHSPAVITWPCGCQQNPLAPVGEFTFRCDDHPIALRFCPVCDRPVEQSDWTPASGYVVEPCGHSSGHLIERSVSGVMPEWKASV